MNSSGTFAIKSSVKCSSMCNCKFENMFNSWKQASTLEIKRRLLKKGVESWQQASTLENRRSFLKVGRLLRTQTAREACALHLKPITAWCICVLTSFAMQTSHVVNCGCVVKTNQLHGELSAAILICFALCIERVKMEGSLHFAMQGSQSNVRSMFIFKPHLAYGLCWLEIVNFQCRCWCHETHT